MENKPREWWIGRKWSGKIWLSELEWEGSIHVIEYSAYEEAREEIESINANLAFIAKEADGIEYERDSLRAEVERLKAERDAARKILEEYKIANLEIQIRESKLAGENARLKTERDAYKEALRCAMEALDFWADETEWLNVPTEFQVARARKALADIRAALDETN